MTVPGVVFLVKSFTDRVFPPIFVMIHVLVCGLFSIFYKDERFEDQGP